jgi:hypothetical protein
MWGRPSPWLYVDLGALDQAVSSVTWTLHPTNVGCNQQMLSGIASCDAKLLLDSYPLEGTIVGVSNTIPAATAMWSGTVCKHFKDKIEVPAANGAVTAVCPSG